MKRIIILIILVATAITGQAQEVYSSSGGKVNKRNQEKTGFDPSRIIYGGGIGLGFANNVFAIAVSPIIGYRISERFAAGIGIGYQYYQANDAIQYFNINTGLNEFYTIKTSIYTGSVWGRFIVWNNIFVQAEVEGNNLETFDIYYDNNSQFVVDKDRITVPSILLGAGIRQPISERVSFLAAALYDVLQQPYSPYRGRIDIRFGVAVGF